MQMPLSEICDRWSILKLKIENLKEDNAISEQFGLFTEILNRKLEQFSDEVRKQIMEEIGEIYKSNAKIWQLEYDIRAGVLNDDDLEEIGRRAIAIREANGRRLKHKNKIAKLSSNLIMFDVKTGHHSESTQ